MIPGLQQSVIDAIPEIFGRWEGAGLSYMYADSKGYVTTGTGNLIDPIHVALALPWKHPDGTAADAAYITTEWTNVKNAYPHVQSTACAKLTTIRLDANGLADLINKTVALDWAYLCGIMPALPALPADAQLMVISSAWAWGPGFCRVWDTIIPGHGNAFKAAMSTPNPDFVTATKMMQEASAREERRNPGIVPRDRGEAVMLANAAAVIAAGDDPTKLWYPAVYGAPANA